MDPKTKSILAALYPPFAERVMRVYARMIAEIGMPMRAVEGCRSFARSNALVAENKVVAAPAGLSIHNYGAAIDSAFVGLDPYLEKMEALGPSGKRRAVAYWNTFGRICEEEKLRWGGDWNANGNPNDDKRPDRGHTELLILIEPRLLYAIYQRGKTAAVWESFDKFLGLSLRGTWQNQTPFNPEAPDA